MIDPLALVALHVAAAMIWIAGMVLLGLADASGAAGLARIRTWNRRVTTPAMIATWVLGIILATTGGWFASPWLQIKLIVVLALSALHSRLSGGLRRRGADETIADEATSFTFSALSVAAAGVVVCLAFVKPF